MKKFKPGDRVQCRDPRTGTWREGTYHSLLPVIVPAHPPKCPHLVTLDESEMVEWDGRKVLTDCWQSDDANIKRKGKPVKFEELPLLEVGHKINLSGAVWGDGEKLYLMLLPWEDAADIENVEMTPESWQALLRQADEQQTEVFAQMPDGTLGKAILRKSTRQIDQRVSWQVYKRDGYKCRYCGADDVPLTVDHLVLWEEGGPSTEPNLLSACRKCNKTRGNMQYADWLACRYYNKVSRGLSAAVVLANYELVGTLDRIPRRVHKMGR